MIVLLFVAQVVRGFVVVGKKIMEMMLKRLHQKKV